VLRMKDVGTGGYDGFTGNFVQQYRYHDGGHGSMFTKQDNIQSMVHFILNGISNPKPQTLPRSEQFNRLALIAPYFGGLLLAMLAFGPWLVHWFGMRIGMINPGIWYFNLATWYLGEFLAIAVLAIVLDVI
jgi:hypothetical protein